MAWNDVSESTVIKCFIKAGILSSEGEVNALGPVVQKPISLTLG
jgi:hypothetical protein